METNKNKNINISLKHAVTKEMFSFFKFINQIVFLSLMSVVIFQL